jgi:hypothetical protein
VFDFAALEVALGLIFVYLVLALVCTAVNETVSSVLAWRADTLREGIANLLGSDEKRVELYQHPVVAGLIRRSPVQAVADEARPSGRARARAWMAKRIPVLRDERYPSYLPARVFAQALLNPVKDGRVTKTKVRDVINELPDGELKEALETMWIEAGGRVDRFRENLETWYDEAMARVSGWYRRKVQFFLWIWAAAVTLLLHADSVQIAGELWSDDAKREAVVARSEQIASGTAPTGSEAGRYLEELDNIEIPLGWGSWPDGEWWRDIFVVVPLNVLGLGMTAVAVTLGAPFWFDTLKRVANIRAAGREPTERPVEKPGQAGEPGAATQYGEEGQADERRRAGERQEPSEPAAGGDVAVEKPRTRRRRATPAAKKPEEPGPPTEPEAGEGA